MAQEDLKKAPVRVAVIRRILSYAKPHKTRLIIGMAAGVLMALSLFSSFFFMVNIFQDVLPGEPSEGPTIEEKVMHIQADSSLTQAQRADQVILLLNPKDKKDPFLSKYESARKTCESLHIPFPVKYDSTTRTLTLGDNWTSFQVEKEGRVAWQIFAVSVFGMVLMFFFKNFFTYINKYCIRFVGARVVERLRNDIFRRLTGQSLKYYGQTDIGVLISRCVADVQAMEQTITLVAADLIRCPFEILACTAGIIYASVATGNYVLPIILFVGVPLCILPVVILGKHVRRIYRNTLQKIGEVSSRMHEVFTGITLVKSCGMETREQERFELVNHRYASTIIKALRYELMMSPLTEAVAVAASLVFLLYAYGQGVSLASLAAMMTPAFLAYQPFKTLSNMYAALQRSLAGADRYFELLDTDVSIPEPENPVRMTDFKKEIAFNNVCFAYNTGDDRLTLDHINFTLPKGQIVAVVGETGSGKSTIANLIARYYDVTEGAVTIDGVDVRAIATDDMRHLIGTVSQTPILFNESIADNIAYGMDNVSREAIIEAAKCANAHEFIVDGRHPDGYDTIVGDKGAILSGGEKQRIAIARAILRNPPILILDEATSALDTVTERLVQDAINKAMSNRTVFAIAHRLSTIRNANCILVIEHGKIVERGTHDQLYALNGRYRKLCNIQFNDQKNEASNAPQAEEKR